MTRSRDRHFERAEFPMKCELPARNPLASLLHPCDGLFQWPLKNTSIKRKRCSNNGASRGGYSDMIFTRTLEVTV